MFWIKYLLIAVVMHLAENKVLSLPYPPDSSGRCGDPDAYFEETLKACCTRCAPGSYVKSVCSATANTVCEECKKGTYLEEVNYAKSCIRCRTCRRDWGLVYEEDCTASSNAKCVCRPGTYCYIRERGSCVECTELTTCPPGQGVSPEEADSEDADVSCSPCAAGTFSNEWSYSQTCQPHTDCEAQGGRTLHRGNATSNSVCGPFPGPRAPEGPKATTPTTTTTTTTTATTAAAARSYRTTVKMFTTAETRTPDPSRTRGLEQINTVSIIVGVLVAAAVLGCVIVFLFVYLIRKRTGDANNNMKKEGNKPQHSASILGLQGSFRSQPPEQQCLLGEKDSSNPSLSLSSSSSSSSSASSDPRSLVDPEVAAHSGACAEGLQASSPVVMLNISATISCQLPPGTQLRPVPTGPATTDSSASTQDLPLSTLPFSTRDMPLSAPDLPLSTPDLPLSKEEERRDPSKEARAAVQESGKEVC
ncbi:tumor necrosis factor receptor superfamily member 1B-like [Conger conger]|uniref:tumor necrosis factor receptor superfamily member 1B-like n=1 Tax=Conger conger TaxID=82655 RepID=UPI002A5AB603|nr:tumor necrosis factor receptor superfamily member 1B-like [Conger conger]